MKLLTITYSLHFRMHEWAHIQYGVFDECRTRRDSISGDLLLGRHAYTFVYTNGRIYGTTYSTGAVHVETQFPETYSSAATRQTFSCMSVYCVYSSEIEETDGGYGDLLDIIHPDIPPNEVTDNNVQPTLSYARVGPHSVRCIRRVPYTERFNFRRSTSRQACLRFRIHEWARYRYGVFDEYGTRGDSISGDLLLGRHRTTCFPKSEVRIGNSSFSGDCQRYKVTSGGCGERETTFLSKLHTAYCLKLNPLWTERKEESAAYTFVYMNGPTFATAYSTGAVHVETQFPETYSSAATSHGLAESVTRSYTVVILLGERWLWNYGRK
ncbi:uncharacterized protein LOC142558364 [Dermacentor variabilis]|uniref:uncharacterized protein LOC142558364 n=1 Tax=Dermacentor variabilis TaxID=34621 RepID=UPI003F5AF49A